MVLAFELTLYLLIFIDVCNRASFWCECIAMMCLVVKTAHSTIKFNSHAAQRYSQINCIIFSILVQRILPVQDHFTSQMLQIQILFSLPSSFLLFSPILLILVCLLRKKKWQDIQVEIPVFFCRRANRYRKSTSNFPKQTKHDEL